MAYEKEMQECFDDAFEAAGGKAPGGQAEALRKVARGWFMEDGFDDNKGDFIRLAQGAGVDPQTAATEYDHAEAE